MPNFNLITALSLLTIAGSQLAVAQGTATNSRLSATATWMLNSGTYIPNDSTSFVYTSAFTTDYASVTSYNLTSGTVPGQQTLYMYDADGFLISMEIQNWNSAKNVYIKGSRKLFTNDASGKMINEQQQIWNNAKSLYENSRNYIYKRSSTGNITQQEDQVWDAGSGLWMKVAQSLNDYNAANRLTRLRTTKYAAGMGPSGSSVHVYTYDAGGAVLLNDTLTDADVLGNLQNTAMTLYTNNAGGKPVSVLNLERSGMSARIDSVLRLTYAYTAGNRTSEITEYWASGTSSWEYSSRVENSFNGDNQISLSTRSIWSGGSFNTPLLRTVYHYERFTPAAVKPGGGNMPSVTVSPNPAVDAVQIAISGNGGFTAQLIDLQGRVHQKFSGNAGSGFSQNISLAAMPAGNYVLNVQSSNGSNAVRMLTVVR